jgi:hypothetical protein
MRTPTEQELREKALTALEQELANGTASLVTDALGNTTIEGGTIPQGMHDSCVLAALQTRNSLSWQLAAGAAGVESTDFAALHSHNH